MTPRTASVASEALRTLTGAMRVGGEGSVGWPTSRPSGFSSAAPTGRERRKRNGPAQTLARGSSALLSVLLILVEAA